MYTYCIIVFKRSRDTIFRSEIEKKTNVKFDKTYNTLRTYTHVYTIYMVIGLLLLTQPMFGMAI